MRVLAFVAFLLKAPSDYAAILVKQISETGGPEWLRLQGRVTRIRYDAPSGRSSLEIMANLQSALSAKTFTTLMDCADAACFTGSLNDPYVLASLDRPKGMVFVDAGATQKALDASGRAVRDSRRSADPLRRWHDRAGRAKHDGRRPREESPGGAGGEVSR